MSTKAGGIIPQLTSDRGPKVGIRGIIPRWAERYDIGPIGPMGYTFWHDEDAMSLCGKGEGGLGTTCDFVDYPSGYILVGVFWLNSDS